MSDEADRVMPAVVSVSDDEDVIVLTTERRFRRGRAKEFKLVDRKTENVEVASFEGPVAELTRSYGFTINLGNYESARFDISLKVPCNVEDVEQADEFAKRFISDRIKVEWNSLKPGSKEG